MESSVYSDQGSSSKSHRGQIASTSMDPEPSPKLHCGPERTGFPKCNEELKIFLSHSGEEKEFVRQLYEDLKAQTLEAFFDETSLPLGERFAPFIFKAARQCLVAVILLSEDFLTSKWPMLELVEFVEAKKSCNLDLKLLPVFYKLTPEDLKDEPIASRWEASWRRFITPAPDQVMPQNDTRRQLDVTSCREALRELRGANGLDFRKYHSVVTYRAAIVKAISLHVLPVLLPDTSDVIGHQRLCENLDEMFVKDTSEDINFHDTLKLGLYGMGGLGKTTMSRALCKFYYKSFNGRVLHVELGSMPPLELQKFVLMELLHINEDVVKRIHDPSQSKELLKDHMKHQPVFLAIDNITSDPESKSQVLAFLEAGFHRGSRIMITSRSLDVVEDLFPSHPNAIYCKPMSKLIKEEAKLIFLQGVQRDLASLTIEEQEILDECISQCHFVVDHEGSQYHPLALHALANYYLEKDKVNMLTWKKHFGDLHKFRHSNASSNIFGVLGLQFMTFKRKGKLIFLDLCLYVVPNPCSEDSAKQLKFLFDIHDNDEEAVNEQLRSLERAGIISIRHNKKGARFITMHDLYLEFAKWFVMDEQDEEEPHCPGLGCVYYTSTNFPYFLKRTCPSSWKVQRIYLAKLSCKLFPSMKVQEWCNVVVLHICECSNLKVLDLHGLRCLCYLGLRKLPMLKSFVFAKLRAGRKSRSNGTPESLQHVLLTDLTSLEQLPDFGFCTSLKTFKMLGCAKFLSRPPSFVGCSQLKALKLQWNSRWRMDNFKVNSLTSLTSLKVLEIYNLGARRWDSVRADKIVKDLTLPGLGNCSRLQKLVLQTLPISSLLGLEKLTELEVLHLSYCVCLLQIPDVSTLANLKDLSMSRLRSLKQLPDFGLCTSLKTFKMSESSEQLSGPPSFVGCSQLEALELEWNQEWLMGEFNVNSLTSLTKLRVTNSGGSGASSSGIIHADNFVNDLTVTGLGNCSRLQELFLQGLSISSLVGLEKLTELQALHLRDCHSLREIPGVSALAKLEVLSITGGLCQEVPGVERLQQVEWLAFEDCPELTLLPNLNHLLKLETVLLRNCRSLKVPPQLPRGCHEAATRLFD